MHRQNESELLNIITHSPLSTSHRRTWVWCKASIIYYWINPISHGGGLIEPPWKVFRMPNFDVIMTPTMSRNIFEVIWKFLKNSIFWVILESILQLKRIFDHFKSWNYPFLCVWWVTKSFELIKVPEVCFPGGGSLSNAPKKSSCQIGLKS